MRVLVTGGAGFIGSAVCRHLVPAGAQVLTIDALTYAASPEALAEVAQAPDYRFVEADIRDGAMLAHLFADFRPEAVLHLAAETHVDRSIDAAMPFVSTNVVGTTVLLEAALTYWRGLDGAARAGFRFVQVSTDEVFGALGPLGTFNETSPYAPSSPYAASKAAADHLARAFAHTHGLPVIITNCTNNYGPFQFPEKLIPHMILQAVAGHTLPVYGDGGQVRDWLHVADHAAALARVVEAGRPGATYLVGARAEHTNLAVVTAICATLDRLRPEGAPHARLIRHVADRPGHDRRYAIDPQLIERDLGWRARIPFATGLSDTVAWYLANRTWWEALRARRYDGRRLGLPGST